MFDLIKHVLTLLMIGLVLFFAWRAIKRAESNRVPLRVPLDLRELEAARPRPRSAPARWRPCGRRAAARRPSIEPPPPSTRGRDHRPHRAPARRGRPDVAFLARRPEGARRSCGAEVHRHAEGRDPRSCKRARNARRRCCGRCASKKSPRSWPRSRALHHLEVNEIEEVLNEFSRHPHRARAHRPRRVLDGTRAARSELRRQQGRRDPRQPRRDDGRGAVRVPAPRRHPPGAHLSPGRAPADDRARARAHAPRRGARWC